MQLLRLHKNNAILGFKRCLFALAILTSYSYSQTNYRSFLEETNLNTKAEKGYQLYHYYIRHDLDSIKVAATELLMSDQIGENQYATAMARRMLGAYLIRTGKHELGRQLLDLSADFFLKNDDLDLASEIFNDIGHGYFLDGQYDEAMKAYQYSLQLGKDATDPTASFNGKLGMARACIATGDTIGAVRLLTDYRNNAINLKKYEAAADGSAILANLYLDKGRYEEGLKILKESIRFSEFATSEIHKSHAFTNLGIFFFMNGEKDSSLFYFNAALSIREKLNNKKSLCEARYNLGDFYRLCGNTQEAVVHYGKAAEIADSGGFIKDEIEALEGLLLILDDKSVGTDIERIKARLDSLHYQVEARTGLDETILGMVLKSQMTSHNSWKESNNYPFLWFVVPFFVLMLMIFLYRRRI